MSTCCITGVGRQEWEGIFAVADDNDNLLCVYGWLIWINHYGGPSLQDQH